MSVTRDYFNSTDLDGKQLAGYEIKATSQNEKVLEFMAHNPTLQVTSEDINRLVMPDAPETSPRRALSVLLRLNLVEKIGKINGKYGRPIYVWRYKRPEPHQKELQL